MKPDGWLVFEGFVSDYELFWKRKGKDQRVYTQIICGCVVSVT